MPGISKGIGQSARIGKERADAWERLKAIADTAGKPEDTSSGEIAGRPDTQQVEQYVQQAIPSQARAREVDAAPQHRVQPTAFRTADLVSSRDAQGFAKPAEKASVFDSPVVVESHPGSSLIVPQGTTVAAGTPGFSGYITTDAGQRLEDVNLPEQPDQSDRVEWTGQKVSRREPVDREVEQRQDIHQLETAQMREDRYSYRDAKGQADVQQYGHIEKPQPRNTNSKSAKRFRKSFKDFRTNVKERIKRKVYEGDTFMDYVHVDATLMPNEVGLGIEDILEALREPNCPIIDLVRDKLIERYGGDPDITREAVLENPQILIDLLNGVRDPSTGEFKSRYKPLDIEVTLNKSPVNWGPSIQVRTLRIHQGHGIYLHPTQVKGYNADFDGDQPSVNLDQGIIPQHSRSMSYLMDTEGRPMVDMKFFPLDTARVWGIHMERMIQCMRERDFSWIPDDVSITAMAHAYVDVCNKPTQENWVKFLKEIDAIATALVERSGFTGNMDDRAINRADKMRSDYLARLFGGAYDFSVTRRKLSLQTQYSQLNPDTVDEQEAVVPDRETFDPMIWHLVSFHDDIVMGRKAPNFQAFATGLHKAYGIEGNANIPFRLVADFAKAIGRTDAIQIGDDIHGIYQIQNADGTIRDSVSVEELWRFTCSCAVTSAISGEMRQGSRDVAISTAVKTMVIKEMGPVPDWSSVPENERDVLFRDWIDRFTECYNKHMRMLNVSQVSWRYDMTPSRDGATKFDGIPEGDGEALAGAIVKVYGELTVGEFFPVSFWK